MSNKIRLIVAMDTDGVIGIHNRLPWTSKEELKHFMTLTKGKCLIMGRKTLESLPVLLKGRILICLSTTEEIPIYGEDCVVFYVKTIDYALKLASQLRPNEDVFIAGGSSIYQQLLSDDKVDQLDISIMKEKANIKANDQVFKIEIDFLKWNCIEKVNYIEFIYFKYSRLSI